MVYLRCIEKESFDLIVLESYSTSDGSILYRQVTRRKRFRCPDCVTESLWADPSHFVERSECLNEFVRAYGHMPLESVEFRADPLLFGETLPDKLKLYRDIGSI